MANKKTFTDEERKAYAEAQKERREELETKVKGLVDSFRDSDTFKTYLSQMSDFNRRCGQYLHHYSPNNLLYIMLQDPTAQLVGAANAWRKMGRFIKKGEHSHIQVWAPVKETVMRNKLDENGQPVLKSDGTPERESVRDENGRIQRRFTGHFTLKPVFDISQTDGEPLPTLAHELKNPVEHFDDYEKAIRDASPLPIYYSDERMAANLPLGNAKGVCSFVDQMIVVKAGMSQEHTLKTMVHEVTHAKFHSPDQIAAALDENGKGFSRNEIEVQAECTAFVVCEHFGLDTSDYSIPYIMSWGEDEKLTPLTNSLDVILKTSDEIIDQMETHLWVDMGIDETLENCLVEEKQQDQRTWLPVAFDPAQTIDANRLFADKTISSLYQLGFMLRQDETLTIDGRPAIALERTAGDDRIRIEAQLSYDKDGYAVPNFNKPETTTLSAFSKHETEPYFFEHAGTLTNQLQSLNELKETERAATAETKETEKTVVDTAAARSLLTHPAVEKLVGAGYSVDAQLIETPNGKVDGLALTKNNGLYTLRVEIVPPYSPIEGNIAVNILHPHTTALIAYDNTKNQPRIFFEARFDASIQYQMKALRANPDYQHLRSQVQLGQQRKQETALDPVDYMKQRQKERQQQAKGPRNLASRSLEKQHKRDHSLER